MGITSSPLTMVLDKEPSVPSSWCQANWASTKAVTLLLGIMGRPVASRGNAMKSGKLLNEGADSPERVTARMRRDVAHAIAQICP